MLPKACSWYIYEKIKIYLFITSSQHIQSSTVLLHEDREALDHCLGGDIFVSLPDRCASTSSLGRASGLAPALEIDTEAAIVVAAFVYADTLAVVVVDP